jgi:RNA polymerase sigma-70 factor (ECF subfamily)
LESFETKIRSEADLLRQLKNGDNQAWTHLTSEYGSKIYNYLRHRLPGPEDVQDVLGETMVAAVRAIPTFDGNVTLTTFLFSLANRKIADFWRRRQPTAELPETLVDSGLSSDSIEFQEVLKKLRPSHLQVLLMRYHVGLGVDEIAKVLGQSYKSTESLLSRARQELRRLLDNTNLNDDD